LTPGAPASDRLPWRVPYQSALANGSIVAPHPIANGRAMPSETAKVFARDDAVAVSPRNAIVRADSSAAKE